MDKAQKERFVAQQAPYSRVVRKGCDLKVISRGVGHLGGQLLTISIFEAMQNSVVTQEGVAVFGLTIDLLNAENMLVSL